MELKYFEISGKPTLEQLKKQYHRLCMQHHPDKGGDEETFRQINKEYLELLEMIRREAHRQNDMNLYRLINEQLYSIEGYINKLNVPEPFKPAISYLVEKGINELGRVIKRKTGIK